MALSALVHATSSILNVAKTLGQTPATPSVQWPFCDTHKGAPSQLEVLIKPEPPSQPGGPSNPEIPSEPAASSQPKATHLCRGVVTGSDDGTARVWDLEGNCRLLLTGHRRPVLSACCSPDGSLVLTAAGNQLWLWDTATAQVRRTLDVHAKRVNAAVFSPCGTKIVSASDDGTVRVTCCRTDRCPAVMEHKGPVISVACSPDGGVVASFNGRYGQPGTVRLWRLDTGECLHSLKAFWCRPSFSADGSMLVFLGSNHEACLHSVESGELIHTFWAPFNGLVPSHFDEAAFEAVAISPDGKLVLTVSMNKDLRIWSRRSGECIQRIREGSNNWASFSEDSQQVLAWPEDDRAQLWDLKTGQCEGTVRVLEDMRVGEAANFRPPAQKVAP